MATNFRMCFDRKKSFLRLKLKGDFDGSSALVLFEALKRNCSKGHRVFVDTDGIKSVYPFGRELFQSNLHGIKNSSSKISFTGKNRAELVSQGPG